MNAKALNPFKSIPSTPESVLSTDEINSFLSKDIAFNRIILYSSLESTNDIAKAMIQSGTSQGTIILADSQTKGRGRYNRSFFSPPGHGIYMSIVLRLDQSYFANHLSLVTLTTAVNICESIEISTKKDPQIKWVNDIFLDGKKVSGILTEKVDDRENNPWIIIGIGINFSTPVHAFPIEIRDTAGSIFSNDPPTITRNQLIAEIINRMFLPCSLEPQIILSEYKKRLMLKGEETLITGFGNPFKGKIVDVDEGGCLVVEKADGQQISLSTGEISSSMCLS